MKLTRQFGSMGPRPHVSFAEDERLFLPGNGKRGGMPLGVQLVGRPDDDPGLIRTAAWLERHVFNRI